MDILTSVELGRLLCVKRCSKGSVLYSTCSETPAPIRKITKTSQHSDKTEYRAIFIVSEIHNNHFGSTFG